MLSKPFLSILTVFVLSLIGVCKLSAQERVNDQGPIDVMTSRLMESQAERSIKTANLDTILSLMRSDGSWPDVVYADTTMAKWKPLVHLERLKQMAIAYGTSGQKYYGDAQLENKLLLGIDYFLKLNPSSKNWWFRDIGAPQQFMVVLLFLKGKIPQDQLLLYAKYLKDATGNAAHRGKNRSWVSEITIYKGCIEHSYQLILSGFQSLASTIYVANKQGDEGIKVDNSFHQHHEQLYSGGYGLSLVEDYVNYMSLAKDTPFDAVFTGDKKKLIFDLLLQGHQLLGYRNSMDFGSMGRNIARPGQTSNISVNLVQKLNLIDTAHSSCYLQWAEHLKGAAFSPGFLGNKFFWKSDIMVQHGPNFYLSAKIISKRTLGTEALNSENIKGYYLPLGATNIKTNGLEYENIFPLWDWARIPGTTAVQNQRTTALHGYLYGANQFGGGLSDGKNGITAFSATYANVAYKKAYFFMNGIMICLGAGIHSDAQDEVLTSVNQCADVGQVMTNLGILKQAIHQKDNLKWVYHDSVGYQFFGKNRVNVNQKIQTGSWNEINMTESKEQLSKSIFNLSISHGKAPVNASYQYLVAPGYSSAAFSRYIAQNQYQIVRNDTIAQAIKHQQSQHFAMVCYAKASVNFGDGLRVNTDSEAIVSIKKNGDQYLVAVADPLYKQHEIKLVINTTLEGPGTAISGHNTTITVQMPTGDLTGSTVINNYKILP
jgi:hypothetical protein